MEPATARRIKCCIVGGGPAGLMAGVLLARAGVEVLVLEKHADFLRDFRGDTVHPSTLDVLAELGWLEDFLRRPHQKLDRIRARVMGTEVTLADFTHCPTRSKFLAFMPQWEFLDFLAQRGRGFPHFALQMNTAATGLIEEDGRIVGVRTRVGEDGAESEVEIHADLVIAADGRHSVSRASAGLPVRDIGAPIDVLWMRLPRPEGDPGQSLGWVQQGRFLVLIDRGDYWQIAFVIRKGAMAELTAKGIEAFRRLLADTAPFLAGRVDALGSFDDVKLLVVQVDRLESWWRPGLLCIGDAAHAMSPVGGVGINLAIQDAVATANLLAGPLHRGAPTVEDLRRVQARRQWPTQVVQAIQVAIQDRILGPIVGGRVAPRAGLALRILGHVPLLQRIPAYIIGVGPRPEHIAY